MTWTKFQFCSCPALAMSSTNFRMRRFPLIKESLNAVPPVGEIVESFEEMVVCEPS